MLRAFGAICVAGGLLLIVAALRGSDLSDKRHHTLPAGNRSDKSEGGVGTLRIETNPALRGSNLSNLSNKRRHTLPTGNRLDKSEGIA